MSAGLNRDPGIARGFKSPSRLAISEGVWVLLGLTLVLLLHILGLAAIVGGAGNSPSTHSFPALTINSLLSRQNSSPCNSAEDLTCSASTCSIPCTYLDDSE